MIFRGFMINKNLLHVNETWILIIHIHNYTYTVL
jgi:hypothetical protein